MKQYTLETDIAFSLRPDEAEKPKVLKSNMHWTGWQKHQWPLDVVRPGLRVYGVNLRTRRICVLLEVSRGGAFQYSSRPDFERKVRAVTGRYPAVDEDKYKIPVPSKGERYNGVAFRWRIIKFVDIPLKGKFRQLGWQRLTNQPLLETDVSLDELYPEGDRRLRTHMVVERRGAKRARAYWRQKLGRLYCMVCGFDFEKRYGELGSGFIEMHHERPLSGYKGRQLTSPSSLKPLCSNCHQMIHYRRGIYPLSTRQLKMRLSHSR